MGSQLSGDRKAPVWQLTKLACPFHHVTHHHTSAAKASELSL